MEEASEDIQNRISELSDVARKQLSRMAALCSRKEYCSSDIKNKLSKKDLSSDEIEIILQKLYKDKYLSDKRYAAAFAREKSALSGWGRNKITFALRGKKIDSADIENALSEIDKKKAEEKFYNVLKRKWKQLEKEEDIQKKTVKLIKFAMSRGYAYDEISDAMKILIKNESIE